MIIFSLFQMHINPENKVAELNYFNNIAVCDCEYTGSFVIMKNCRVVRQ